MRLRFMRFIRAGLMLGLLLALGVAGCGAADDGVKVATAGGQGSPTSGATSAPPSDGLTDQERRIKFAQCMRENGVPEFPDPEVDGSGGVRLELPEGVNRQQVDAAMEKCRQYLPGGGKPPKPDPERAEQMRKFAQCMREHGVPNFPDPSTDGGIMINSDELGINPDDPEFKAAQEACAKELPAPPSGAPGGGPQTRTNR